MAKNREKPYLVILSHPATSRDFLNIAFPLDALAALTAFIPEKGLQLARYYG
jgi:hypothetical protein